MAVPVNTYTTFKCSTPFGIIGCYAQVAGQRQGIGSLVLNAFRHHRVLRGLLPGLVVGDAVCSTPFGIIGCYARDAGDLLPGEKVLNAFRHHRVLRWASRPKTRFLCSAQRLSAS